MQMTKLNSNNLPKPKLTVQSSQDIDPKTSIILLIENHHNKTIL